MYVCVYIVLFCSNSTRLQFSPPFACNNKNCKQQPSRQTLQQEEKLFSFALLFAIVFTDLFSGFMFAYTTRGKQAGIFADVIAVRIIISVSDFVFIVSCIRISIKTIVTSNLFFVYSFDLFDFYLDCGGMRWRVYNPI